MSFGPPGANGTTRRIGFAGYGCAPAEWTSPVTAMRRAQSILRVRGYQTAARPNLVPRSADRRIEQRCNMLRRPFMNYLPLSLTLACRGARGHLDLPLWSAALVT